MEVQFKVLLDDSVVEEKGVSAPRAVKFSEAELSDLEGFFWGGVAGLVTVGFIV